MSEVLATVVIEFGDGADSTALVVVELDNAVNTDSTGQVKTRFVPGDRPGFRVHFDADALRIGSVACSSGMVADHGETLRQHTMQVRFAGEADRPQLRHIPATVPSWRWHGNAPTVHNDGRELAASGALPAIGEATYGFACHAYQLVPPPLDLTGDATWPILVVVTMEAAA